MRNSVGMFISFICSATCPAWKNSKGLNVSKLCTSHTKTYESRMTSILADLYIIIYLYLYHLLSTSCIKASSSQDVAYFHPLPSSPAHGCCKTLDSVAARPKRNLTTPNQGQSRKTCRTSASVNLVVHASSACFYPGITSKVNVLHIDPLSNMTKLQISVLSNDI